MMSKVHAATYTTDQFPADNHYGAEVKVTLHGGTVIGAKVDRAAGRTSADPMSQERLKEKFDNCANRALSPDRAAAAYEAIMNIENLTDVRDVNNAMIREAAERRPANTAARV
jgi:hypothetical protein